MYEINKKNNKKNDTINTNNDIFLSLCTYGCDLMRSKVAALQIYGEPGSLSHDFRIWPITFQGSRPSGPILFSCEKISLYSESTNSTKQKVHLGCQYSKTCLKQPLRKKQKQRSPWSILQYY